MNIQEIGIKVSKNGEIMNTINTQAEELLRELGIKSFTKRHLKIITDFIVNSENNVERLLTHLGEWDEADLQIANE